jgi:hypothetical protein
MAHIILRNLATTETLWLWELAKRIGIPAQNIEVDFSDTDSIIVDNQDSVRLQASESPSPKTRNGLYKIFQKATQQTKKRKR